MLTALAVAQGIDGAAFAALFASDELRAATREGFAQTHAARVYAFPTLLGTRGRELECLCRGYQSEQQLVTR